MARTWLLGLGRIPAISLGVFGHFLNVHLYNVHSTRQNKNVLLIPNKNYLYKFACQPKDDSSKGKNRIE